MGKATKEVHGSETWPASEDSDPVKMLWKRKTFSKTIPDSLLNENYSILIKYFLFNQFLAKSGRIQSAKKGSEKSENRS